MDIKKSLENRIRGWLPKESKTPSQALYQPMFKGWTGSLLTGIGAALIVLGLSFCFSSSFYVDGYLPATAILDVIGHYLEGIAIGCVFLASGVILVVFGIKKSQNNYFTPQNRTSENCIKGWLPKDSVAVYPHPTSKSIWWKSLWTATWVFTVVLGIISYVALRTPLLQQVIIALFLVLVCIATEIYIHIKPSSTNRGVYVLVGITSLGFLLSVAYEFLLWRYVTGWPLGWFNIVAIIGILTAGGFVGDWIGKRGNYQLPLSP
jgi:hypothetical protein